MKKIKVLDCTLRDGGRVINCAFMDRDIADIANRLSDAGIDIIEIGFLRNQADVPYSGNTTFFTDMKQIKNFIPEKSNSAFVVFIDFGMYDFSMLPPYNEGLISGIRVGFTRKDFLNSARQLKKAFELVKRKGYQLYIQDVNTLGYSDKELLNIIEMVNDIEPYAFAIVDTYGAMYDDDLMHYYDLLERNLNEKICIDFHSHNNFQLSFSLAQCLLKKSHSDRTIIIDATLDGMGKCAGNLNTELLADYLVQKYFLTYNVDMLLDIIDDHLYSLKHKYNWGYSTSAVMAGKLKAHPNNVIYLTEKYRLPTKDIKYILQHIDPEKRQRYDYENIRQIYIEYNSHKVNDCGVKKLKDMLYGKELLLLFPGFTLKKYRACIEKFILKNRNIQILSVNFVTNFGTKENRIAFFGSEKRYIRWEFERKNEMVISTSNIKTHLDSDLLINYESLLEYDDINFDNTTVMLFNLMIKLGIYKIYIAGLDGYGKYESDYYDQEMFGEMRNNPEDINKSISKALEKYKKYIQYANNLTFITPSYFEEK